MIDTETEQFFERESARLSQNRNSWIVLGNAADGAELIRESELPLPENFTCWTIPKDAQIGDKVFFYICAPLSAIVATGTVATKPEENEMPSSRFFGHYFAEINNLEKQPQTPIRNIRKLFPEWAFWRYPRRNSLIPQEFVEPFEILVTSPFKNEF